MCVGGAGQVMARVPPAPRRRARRPTRNLHGNGEGGIRTRGTLRFTGFQDRLLKPLGHLSEGATTLLLAGLSFSAARTRRYTRRAPHSPCGWGRPACPSLSRNRCNATRRPSPSPLQVFAPAEPNACPRCRAWVACYRMRIRRCLLTYWQSDVASRWQGCHFCNRHAAGVTGFSQMKHP